MSEQDAFQRKLDREFGAAAPIDSEDYWHVKPEPPEEPRFCDQCMSNHPNTTPCSDYPEEDDE